MKINYLQSIINYVIVSKEFEYNHYCTKLFTQLNLNSVHCEFCLLVSMVVSRAVFHP